MILFIKWFSGFVHVEIAKRCCKKSKKIVSLVYLYCAEWKKKSKKVLEKVKGKTGKTIKEITEDFIKWFSSYS